MSVSQLGILVVDAHGSHALPDSASGFRLELIYPCRQVYKGFPEPRPSGALACTARRLHFQGYLSEDPLFYL